MKIPYFQRYTKKENVVTSNTMLLFQRLLTHSPSKYYFFLKEIVDANAETDILLQPKIKGGSTPDSMIKQPSVNITIETKMTDSFNLIQLTNHLASFSVEDHQILLTLCPISEPTSLNKSILHKEIDKHNTANKTHIVHKHITFGDIVNKMESVVTPLDAVMYEVLSDYKEYCIEENLIPRIWMKIRAVGTTIKDNVDLDLYYHPEGRPRMDGYKFLGLYTDKKVQYIGEVVCKVVYDAVRKTFTPDHNDITYYNSHKTTVEKNIKEAVRRSITYGYNLNHVPHRYFIVDKFIPTNYKKNSPGGLFGERAINLTDEVKAKNTDSANDIAKKLNGLDWQ